MLFDRASKCRPGFYLFALTAVIWPCAVRAQTPVPAPEVTKTRAATTQDYVAGELPPDVRIIPPETIPPYNVDDTNQLRARHSLPELSTSEPRRARWHCLIADPSCGHSIEVTALSAYARRMRQTLAGTGDGAQVKAWNSARVDYSVHWLAPVVVRVRDTYKLTVAALGMQAGIVTGDDSELWGKMGFGSRFWLGEGAWSPAIDFQAGLSFKLRGTDLLGNRAAGRSPMGFYGDVGFNVGGFGAIVVGGHYETALARPDAPAVIRSSPAGSIYVGFRGNIIWGAPLAASVTTHALAQRFVTRD